MAYRTLLSGLFAAFVLSACSSSGDRAERRVVEEVSGGVNPYLWRASLDTMGALPVISADPVGGLILYDWHSFENAPDERIKATVYILDTRLRADGVKVSVFRQTRLETGEWADAGVSADTAIQLENSILERARALKVSEIT